MNYFLTIVFALISMLSLHGQSRPAPSAQAELTNRNLIPGEQTYLIIRLQNAQPNSRPAAPEVPNTAVNFVRTVTQLDNRRQLTQIFVYRLTPAKTGKYTIPPVTLDGGGKRHAGKPLSFEVHDPDKLLKVPSGIFGMDILVGWFPEKTTLYQGEQCPVSLKLYIPEQLRPINWGLPEAEKDNCLAWRFSQPSNNERGKVTINSKPYLSAPYTTTMSGIAPGTATLGPARLRIVARQRTINPRFGSSIQDKAIELNLPKLDLNILPLPAGAPADFTGAVGQFHINTQCAKTFLNDTDSIEVMIEVMGTGNLENIQAPKLTAKGWKIIDTTKMTRGEERRMISGKVTFRQLLRPERSNPLPSSIPPHSLSFFNPESKSYYTLKTSAIPVNITSTLPAVTGLPNDFNTGELPGTRPEQMSDILAFISNPSAGGSTIFKGPMRYWHLIPALVCLWIISIPIIRRIRASASRHPDELLKKEALGKLAKTTDTRTFYRRAGRFIDQWLSPDDELNIILAQRNEICFQPEETQAAAMSEQRRKEITKLLKRCSKLKLIILLATLSSLSALTTPLTQAADDHGPGNARDALNKGQYQQAIELYTKQYRQPTDTPADILYNIGNSHYRLDQPGHAALAWRRALAKQPNHQAARQNLRFVELKQGALTPRLESWQQPLTTLAFHLYEITLYASLWLLLITILALTLIRPQRNLIFVIILVITPLTASVAALGIYYYPDTDVHSSYQQQALCMENTTLHAEAHQQGNPLTTIPLASLVTIDATRGAWSHIQLIDGESGWVESRCITAIWPD